MTLSQKKICFLPEVFNFLWYRWHTVFFWIPGPQIPGHFRKMDVTTNDPNSRPFCRPSFPKIARNRYFSWNLELFSIILIVFLIVKLSKPFIELEISKNFQKIVYYWIYFFLKNRKFANNFWQNNPNSRLFFRK